MTEYDAHYRGIEDGLNRLLTDEEGNLSSEEIGEVREFLDAREYGLALETLAAILDEHVDIPSSGTIRGIQELAQSMDIVHDAPIAGLIARIASGQRP